MNKEKLTIYLAALLHDIGKFWQRADTYDKAGKRWTDLDKSSFREADFCPEHNGFYSHKHVLWTAQFVEKILVLNDLKIGKESLTQLAAKHHAPSNFLENLVTVADHLSSGMDRNQLTGDARDEMEGENYKSTALLSVFEQLGKDLYAPDEPWKYRLPLRKYNAGEIMPGEKENISVSETDYQALWKDFLDELAVLKSNYNGKEIDAAYADTLLFLLQKYTSYIPSSTVDLPDVSLYDHSKTVAAFAVCLYEYAKENKIEDVKFLDNEDVKPFLLYGADVSGIQKYIYNVKSKYAAKNLKGRSFMLHLFTTTVIRKILDELDLYQAHIIYNSGGGFYLLLPNTDRVKAKLSEIEAEVEAELLDKFGGHLYLATGYVPFGNKVVRDKNLGCLWKHLSDEINKSKRQRFRKSIENDYGKFFEPSGTPGDIEKDSLTGEELEKNAIRTEGMALNPLTYMQIELGKNLKQAKYWYIVKGGWSEREKPVEFLGYSHLLSPNEDVQLHSLANAVKIKLNGTEGFISGNVKGLQMFEFYGGNDYPVDKDGSPKTFDELTDGNLNKLGIVRMDVDNLGYVFQRGFEKHLRTFSRMAALSRGLDLFFKGYINTLWKSKEAYKANVFILYAGGDDVFVLGDWKIVMDFAEELRNDFRKYVCRNPYLTLSGGERLTPPKYPILKAAEEAEDVEKAAKEYAYVQEKIPYRIGKEEKISKFTKQKDAFTFLDAALGWESEWGPVKDMAEALFEKVNANKLPKAFLQKIMAYYERKNEKRTTWLMSYDFGRMAGRYKKEAEFIEGVLLDIQNNTWKGEAHTFAHKSFELYAVAARWAEFLYRNERKKSEINQEMLT